MPLAALSGKQAPAFPAGKHGMSDECPGRHRGATGDTHTDDSRVEGNLTLSVTSLHGMAEME